MKMLKTVVWKINLKKTKKWLTIVIKIRPHVHEQHFEVEEQITNSYILYTFFVVYNFNKKKFIK